MPPQTETPPQQPPPPNTWQVSPATQNQSPLRRYPQISSSPILFRSNLPGGKLGSQVLIPELGGMTSGIGVGTGTDSDNNDLPLTFHAPELPAETILDKQHNETLAKLNFVLALTDCILEVADARCAPLSALMAPDAPPIAAHAPEHCKRAERLVLLVRSLHLLRSGLLLAQEQIQLKNLKPSSTVKTGEWAHALGSDLELLTNVSVFLSVLNTMNSKYRQILAESKKLNGSGLLKKADANNITADKILYDHAIETCKSAALDELFGNPVDCFSRYQTAQILLHSLAQKCNNPQDKRVSSKYKEAVEKRLYILQQQGIIYATQETEEELS